MPASVQRIVERFERMGREEKMQALLQYARRLEPVPEHLRQVEQTGISVPECQTPVRIFPERRDGRMHFYAEVDVRQSPTVAAFLAILFTAINDHTPEDVLAVPNDFARRLMDGLGLAGREVGLSAIVGRVKGHAERVGP